ncbi:MAG TPA: DUF4410 domain-containing protein [Burkholderiaceae bacterium]|nr:DUF4410 domain-containing protein [Burkholderiaceae bacterium]
MGFLVLLTGCAGTIKQDPRVQGDLSRLEGVAQVVAKMSPDAAKQQGDNPQFNREELATRLRYRLESRGLTAPAATHQVEIVVTDIRVRGAFAAIMFGFMAGDDHVTGRVRVLDPSGRALRSFEVKASYAFGGLAGGQDSMRMNWLYDKFADMAAEELQKFVTPPRAGAGAIAPTAAAGQVPPALPRAAVPESVVATPAAGVPSMVAVDNVDAVPVSERGREAYRDWLTHRKPRAFVVSENGWFYSTWGTKPRDPTEPTDPLERVMKRCRDAARPNCQPYAIDDNVVYVKPGSPVAAAAAN